MSGYGCVATGVAFVTRRVGGVRRTHGGVQEAPDTLEAQGVVGGEGGGGGAVAVGGNQLGDIAFDEAVAQAPWTRRGWSGGTRRAVSATV
jgi:hypothetical protein